MACLIAIMFPRYAAADIYLSNEVWLNNAKGRSATSLLDDPWRAMVLRSRPNASFEQPDNLADEGALPVPPPFGILEFPRAGVNVAYSVRSMDGPMYGSAEANVAPEYSSSQATEPLSYAPVPGEMIGTGVGGNDYTDFYSGSYNVNARTAILFEFSSSVTAFGLFLGDVESRPAGALAEIRLYDEFDNWLNPSSSELIATGTVLFSHSVNSLTIRSYDVFDNTPIIDAQGRWGNGTTQYYGFVDEGPVSKMLLIVGDEDFGQALV
jgi:hypothetical protein